MKILLLKQDMRLESIDKRVDFDKNTHVFLDNKGPCLLASEIVVIFY